MTMKRPLLERYDTLVVERDLRPDAYQREAVKKLQALVDLLAKGQAPAAPLPKVLRAFFWQEQRPRGLYLWGPVGRGKTMLMNLFFDMAPVEKKRRAHFHGFMADVHDRLHRLRREAVGGLVDPVTRVAQEIASETRLLCFDEFSVTDIADAMILARLFATLFAENVLVVATSNVEPSKLYDGGRNRDLFLPFIALLQERMDVMRLAAPMDYRAQQDCAGGVFFAPADAPARAAMDALFLSLTGGAHGAPVTIDVKQRAIFIPQAAGRVARMGFAEICGQPHSAADYLAIAERFDAVMLEDVPVLAPEQRNEARRLIMLVDVLYEAHALLALSAAAEPEYIYDAPHGAEAREYRRTVSRLAEMRSRAYLEACVCELGPGAFRRA
ncbi:cell division protein ZapE [Methylocystis sp. JAN1]|uniref:cell division protein ZapE n=1 Tax=Methylocystis sp. JAN1 TaxID=3397211 RepID=UPI003FA1E60E